MTAKVLCPLLALSEPIKHHKCSIKLQKEKSRRADAFPRPLPSSPGPGSLAHWQHWHWEGGGDILWQKEEHWILWPSQAPDTGPRDQHCIQINRMELSSGEAEGAVTRLRLQYSRAWPPFPCWVVAVEPIGKNNHHQGLQQWWWRKTVMWLEGRVWNSC